METCEPLRNGCTEREKKKATQLASYSCCNLCASTYCALYHPFQLLPFFSLFSALLGYVQSIPQAALDFRPRVIFFFHLLTYLPTYLPLVFDFSFFLGEFVIPACAFLCTSMDHPQSTREHPQSALDFRPLSHLSLSLTYLPVFLVFALFLMRKFVLQACAFWLVGWCTSMFHKYIHKKTCLWNFFFSVSFLLRDFESFFFLFFGSTNNRPNLTSFWQPPKTTSSLAESWQEFHLQTSGFEPVLCM